VACDGEPATGTGELPKARARDHSRTWGYYSFVFSRSPKRRRTACWGTRGAARGRVARAAVDERGASSSGMVWPPNGSRTPRFPALSGFPGTNDSFTIIKIIQTGGSRAGQRRTGRRGARTSPAACSCCRKAGRTEDSVEDAKGRGDRGRKLYSGSSVDKDWLCRRLVSNIAFPPVGLGDGPEQGGFCHDHVPPYDSRASHAGRSSTRKNLAPERCRPATFSVGGPVGDRPQVRRVIRGAAAHCFGGPSAMCTRAGWWEGVPGSADGVGA